MMYTKFRGQKYVAKQINLVVVREYRMLVTQQTKGTIVLNPY
jgi:hypothetical protein